MQGKLIYIPLFFVGILFSLRAWSAPRIVIDSFRIAPQELAVGEKVTFTARAHGEGVEIGSFVFRHAHPVKADQALPSFAHRVKGGRAYLAQEGDYLLKDNAPLDQSEEQNVFSVVLNTEEWKDGTYYLTFFAHNRPASGPHIKDFRNVRIRVQDGRVQIEDIQGKGTASMEKSVRVSVKPARIRAGDPLTLSIQSDPAVPWFTLHTTYTILPEETLPGFVYDEQERMAHLQVHGKRRISSDSVQLKTDGWPSGLHALSVDLSFTGPYTGAGPLYRDLVVDVEDPEDRLQVMVAPSAFFQEGTHFGKLTRLRNGILIANQWISKDNGETWKKIPSEPTWVGVKELRQGHIIGIAYKTRPKEGEKGTFVGELWESRDAGKTVQGPKPVLFHVPQGRGAMGHAFHPGPLFMRSIVEAKDGSLLALMAGWFEGDDVPSPYGGGRTQSRTYVCRSSDQGETWDYLNTIGYDPELGAEGYNEASMQRLPNGEILCVLRTGGDSCKHHQDNPLMMSRSRDEGKTWTQPVRIGVDGVYPDLLVLSDDTVACSYGRPGASLMFSHDMGKTWTDHTSVDPERYSGYTAICEIASGELLMGYGAKNWLDPATGERFHCLRLARIQYRPAS